jgi:hypothetical protein
VVVQAGSETSTQSGGGDGRCQTARIAFEDLCADEAQEAVFMSRIEQFSQLVAQCTFQRGLATVFSQLLQHDESSCELYIKVRGVGRGVEGARWQDVRAWLWEPAGCECASRAQAAPRAGGRSVIALRAGWAAILAAD